MRKYVTQVFEDINSNPKLLEQYVKDPLYNVLIKTICEYAFDPTKK